MLTPLLLTNLTMPDTRQNLNAIIYRFEEIAKRRSAGWAEWTATDITGEPTVGWKVGADDALTRDELRMTCLEALQAACGIPGIAEDAKLAKYSEFDGVGLWCELVRWFEPNAYQSDRSPIANFYSGRIHFLGKYSALAVRQILLEYSPKVAHPAPVQPTSSAKIRAASQFQAAWAHLITVKEVKEVAKFFRTAQDIKKLEMWYDKFSTALRTELAPLAVKLANHGVTLELDQLITAYIEESKDRILKIIEQSPPGELALAIEQEVSSWPERAFDFCID